MTDTTTQKQQIGRPFLPGQSGNPAGRPKGARNKYSEAYIADIASAWGKHGPRLLEDWAADAKKHDLFLRAITAGLTRDVSLDMKVGAQRRAEDLTDDELAAIAAGDSAEQPSADE